MSKKSFILHNDSLSILDELDDTQAGKLFRAIRSFQQGEEMELDTITRIAFTPFKNQFIRDNEKHQSFVEEQSAKGKKSAESKKNKSSTTVNHIQPMLTESTAVDNGQPLSTESTYNDSVSVSKNDNDSKKESVSDNKSTHTIFFDFSFYKTSYTELPEQIKQTINTETWSSWQMFNEYIDENCPRIRQIPTQINLNEYLEYKQGYILSKIIDTLKLKSMLRDFNNHNHIEKYNSVYPALCKWTDRER